MSAPGRRFRGADQAGVVGGDDQLGAIARLQLHEQAADVGLGGGQADVQVGCDLGVGQAEPDQGQDLALPFGYVIPRDYRARLGFGAPGELRDKTPGDPGGEQRVAGRDHPDRGQQVGRRVSLSRKPLAPARSAAKMYSSRSKVVRISPRTAEVSAAAVICLVASIPSMPGIRISIRTMSGFPRRASSTASVPVAASPTEARSGAVSTRMRKLPRTRAWSSATSTRMVMPPCLPALCLPALCLPAEAGR